MMARPPSSAADLGPDADAIDVITPVLAQFYFLRDASALLGISPITARRQIAEDRFPLRALKVGGRWAVRRADLDTFLHG